MYAFVCVDPSALRVGIEKNPWGTNFPDRVEDMRSHAQGQETERIIKKQTHFLLSYL